MHMDQYEFGGGVTTAFRLLTETTLDGEREQRDIDDHERRQAEAAKLQVELFPDLA